MRTVQSEGLLLFSGNIGSGKDFMALELVNGRLRYVFDLGAGARTVIAGHDPTAPLSDDLWHEVSVVRSTLSEHVIRVDDDVTSDHLLDGRSLFFDTGEELYIGGVPEFVYNALPKQIRSRDGFSGCIADLQLDRRTINLLEHPIGIPKTHRRLVVSGCENPSDGQHDEGIGKHCTEKTCDNAGLCIQQTSGFVCNCDMTSYTGPTCKDDSIAYKFGRQGGVVTFTFPDGEWPDTKRDEISLGFRTFQSDAVLLHLSSASSNDFIEMELVDGNVVVIYNMGLMQHPIGELFEKFDDGRHHVVRFTRDGSNSTIQVDSLPVQPKYPTEFYQRESELDDAGQQLTTFNNQQTILTGGKKDDSGNLVRPFHGTISGLVVNGLRILDLASERDERVTIEGDVELEVKVMRPPHQPRTLDPYEPRTRVALHSTVMEWNKSAMAKGLNPVTDDLVIAAAAALTTDQGATRRRACPFDDCPVNVHPSSTDSFIRPITRRSTITDTKSLDVTSSSSSTTPTSTLRHLIAAHLDQMHPSSSGEDLLVPCLDDDEDCGGDTGSSGDGAQAGNQPRADFIRPRSPPYRVTPTETRRLLSPGRPSAKPHSRPHLPETTANQAIPRTPTQPRGHSYPGVDEVDRGQEQIQVDGNPDEVDPDAVEASVDRPGGLSVPGRSLTMNIGLIAGIGAGVIVLIVVLAYALYKFNSRNQGTRKMGQLSQLGDYDDIGARHSILASKEPTEAGPVAGGTPEGAGSAAKRKKKDIKEWYV